MMRTMSKLSLGISRFVPANFARNISHNHPRELISASRLQQDKVGDIHVIQKSFPILPNYQDFIHSQLSREKSAFLTALDERGSTIEHESADDIAEMFKLYLHDVFNIIELPLSPKTTDISKNDNVGVVIDVGKNRPSIYIKIMEPGDGVLNNPDLIKVGHEFLVKKKRNTGKDWYLIFTTLEQTRFARLPNRQEISSSKSPHAIVLSPPHGINDLFPTFASLLLNIAL